MLFIRAEIHKMHFRIANREATDQTASSLLVQTQSDLGIPSLYRLLWQAASREHFEHLP